MALRTDSNFALYSINSLVIITEVESVYSAVRTDSLYNTDTFRLYRVCRPSFKSFSDLDNYLKMRVLDLNVRVPQYNSKWLINGKKNKYFVVCFLLGDFPGV
jgi:hypothetical protein